MVTYDFAFIMFIAMIALVAAVLVVAAVGVFSASGFSIPDVSGFTPASLLAMFSGGDQSDSAQEQEEEGEPTPEPTATPEPTPEGTRQRRDVRAPSESVAPTPSGYVGYPVVKIEPPVEDAYAPPGDLAATGDEAAG